ncbi:MAG: hypothetical protein P8011_01110 [Acidihalobacter sp.]|uniref:hypothetical protein n=1 Tax=Acidihalobacter sp. TaxID=1872108 RepID=UPI00307DE9D6
MTKTKNGMWNKTSVGLMAGSALAGFSFWVDLLVILTLAAYEYKASPFVMAFISATLIVPRMLVGPAVGRWLDRTRLAPTLMGALEPPRDLRRLQHLREWSHEQSQEVFPRSA